MSVVDTIKTISQFQFPALAGMAVGLIILVSSLIWGFRSAPRGHEQKDEVPRVEVIQQNINSFNNQQTVNITQNNIYNYPPPPVVPAEAYVLPAGAEVRLLAPEPDAVIPRNLEVHAVTKGLGADDDVWLVIYAPSIRRFYPVEVVNRKPEWKTSIIVGAVVDHGSHFTISVFVTNKAGSDYLRQFKGEELFRLPPGHSEKVAVRREYI